MPRHPFRPKLYKWEPATSNNVAVQEPLLAREDSKKHSKMIKIAIAGATSGIGLAFRQQLDEQNSHEYIILVRKPLDHDPKAVIVDYSSTAALADTLRTYAIHTVISALSISDKASGVAQLRLIEAASQSKCVQRFLPSEFGADYHEG